MLFPVYHNWRMLLPMQSSVLQLENVISSVSKLENVTSNAIQCPATGSKTIMICLSNRWYSAVELKRLFNDALNTFYLLLYGVGNMVQDHSYSERGNLLPLHHGLHFLISNKGSFICFIPDMIAHSYTSCGAVDGT